MTVGMELTVILKVVDVPAQPFSLGVMVTVAEPSVVVNAGIEVTPVSYTHLTLPTNREV